MKLFFQSFIQVGLVALNTYLIANNKIVAVFIVSCLISYVWTFNVSKVAISTHNEKLIYAFGAGCGAITSILLTKILVK